MVVQHNLTAMNANRQLGITTGAQAKSSEKLSSGYKINRAADDAAGLTISEKMRSQVRGLNKASDNAQDGVSLIHPCSGRTVYACSGKPVAAGSEFHDYGILYSAAGDMMSCTMMRVRDSWMRYRNVCRKRLYIRARG